MLSCGEKGDLVKNQFVLSFALAVALVAPAAQAQPTPVFDSTVLCRQPDRLVLAGQSIRASSYTGPDTGARPPWVFTTPTAPWQSFAFRPIDPSQAIHQVDAGWSVSVPEFVRTIRLGPGGFALMPVAPPSRTGTPPTYLTMDWWYVADFYWLRGLRFASSNSTIWWDYDNFAEYAPSVTASDGSRWRQTAYLYCVPAGSRSLEFGDLVHGGNTVEFHYNSVCRRWDCENVWQ
ncbi:hypothetical protein KBD34_04470 [Patescibacteria group bacterium]|nr:hypothetical protein [Patescibacteria group bacterium]